MKTNFLRTAMQWIWEQIDPFVALVIAFVCGILGLLNTINLNILISANLATLTILAFTLMRERSGREQLSEKVDNLIGRMEDPIADSFFSRQTPEIPLLQDAEQEIWLVQETGNRLIETYRREMISLLEHGGHVRMVLSSSEESIARLMSLRNANLNPSAIISRAASFQHQIQDIVDKVKILAEHLEVRFVAYPIDMTCVITDPQHPNTARRKAVIRHAGFRVPYEHKLDFTLNGRTSPKTSEHYYTEIRRLFEHASKVVLITGAPRVGKSTLLKNILANIEDKTDIFSVLSLATWAGRERKGFEVVVSGNPQAIPFATRNASGTYDTIPGVWSNLLPQLALAYKEEKVIILDEIGALQLQDEQFRNFVSAIINDPFAVLFATIALDDNVAPLIKSVKYHYRSTVLQLVKNRNEKAIEDEVMRELQASLRVAKILRHRL